MLGLTRDDRRAARRPADWLADSALFGFAVTLGALAQAELWPSHGVLLDWIDLGSGVLACLALWWRRAHPVAVMLVAFGAAWFSPLALGAGLVAIGTAASRARGRALLLVALLAVLGSVVFPLVNPAAGEILQVGFPAFLFTVIAFGWGLYARTRRELVASLRERAERLEADQQRSAEQAREAERRRIAREMHDVLAHQLSLLSVHAGALEFRPDAPPGEITRAAAVIRASAAAALRELRQVITVLREDSDAAAGPPQPELAQLPALLEESRAAGMTLREHLDLTKAEPLPAAAQRAAYRVVQEGLTNARKHAPGAIVDVTVTRTAQAGLVAEIVSRRTPGGAPPPVAAPDARRAPAGPDAAVASVLAQPGPGAGLIGLAERLALVGGDLQHGTNAMGDFVLRATIPGCSMTAPIRVLIVDDDALVRSGLTMMLSGAPQIEVIGEADDGRGVLAAVNLHRPDVVLMDIRMPRLDGIAATRLLSAQPHPPAVLVLTTFDADELVLRALQAGAAGFLLKDSPPADIVRAIDSVYAGDGMLSPRITRRLINLVGGDPDAAARREQARQRLAALTPREREVAAAVADGSSNAEIATRLHMSLATVKAHVSRLLVKLDAANRVQIALLVQDAASR